MRGKGEPVAVDLRQERDAGIPTSLYLRRAPTWGFAEARQRDVGATMLRTRRRCPVNHRLMMPATLAFARTDVRNLESDVTVSANAKDATDEESRPDQLGQQAEPNDMGECAGRHESYHSSEHARIARIAFALYMISPDRGSANADAHVHWQSRSPTVGRMAAGQRSLL